MLVELDLDKFASAVRLLLDKKNWTYKEAEKETGICYNTFYRISKFQPLEGTPLFILLILIKRELGYEPSWFIKEG